MCSEFVSVARYEKYRMLHSTFDTRGLPIVDVATSNVAVLWKRTQVGKAVVGDYLATFSPHPSTGLPVYRSTGVLL